MPRPAIILVALLIGAAAPARAWCEASCLAPVDRPSGTSHCPAEHSTSGTTITSAHQADCPVVESAPPVKLRSALQVASTFAAEQLRNLAPSPRTAAGPRTVAPPHLRTLALARLVPLRI